MSALKPVFDAFGRGEASFETLCEAVRAASRAGPDALDEARALVGSDVPRDLDPAQQLALSRALGESPDPDRTELAGEDDRAEDAAASADPRRSVTRQGSDDPDDDETTHFDVFATGGDDPDVTRRDAVPRAGARSDAPPAPDPDSDSDSDDDAPTVVRPAPDPDDDAPTVVRPGRDVDDDDVPTQVRAGSDPVKDEDPTVPPASIAAGHDGDVAHRGGATLEDRTVFSPGPAAGVDGATVRRGPGRMAGEAVEAPSRDAALRVSGAEPTVVNAGEAGSDRTLVTRGEAVDQTTLPGADEAFDILDADAMAAAERALAETGPGSPAASAATAPEPRREYEAGDVLKDRFELVSKLGEGGMGAVWKATDRLKEEARDRNPFVAVKLLTGDFKQHPEAFIALQRETSKQQRLAHPNVATVFDFDRDGDTVYMTMEVMEGQALDAYVRKLPADGLPEDEAMALIEQLCAGLAYAHKAGLVHSDLKPGNCFLTNDGALKLLDFGIARASKTQADAEGEATLFDPGQLGALTPTYATIEMFEGQDPDPRDDVYALAIMSYQLLTGRHPYGKKSAPQALELGLAPGAVDKLAKRQNRGLARGLAFHRDDRTPSVEEFLDELRRRKSAMPVYAAVAGVLLVLGGLAAYKPYLDYQADRQREALVAEIEAGIGFEGLRSGLDRVFEFADPEQQLLVMQDTRVKDAIVSLMTRSDAGLVEGLDLVRQPGFDALEREVLDDPRPSAALSAMLGTGEQAEIDRALALMAPFPDDWQRRVKDEPGARAAVIGRYTDAMYEVVDPARGRYDYAQARRIVGALEGLYPDSAEVFKVRTDLAAHESAELAALGARYRALLDAGALMADPGGEDIGDVLGIVARFAPDHALLSDPALATRFTEIAREAMVADDYSLAAELLAAGLARAPGDAALARLDAEVGAELARREEQRQVTEILARLQGNRSGFTELGEIGAARDDLLALVELSPDEALLEEMRPSLEAVVGRGLDRHGAAGDWSEGERLLSTYAPLLGVEFLMARRADLGRAGREAGQPHVMTEERRVAVAERIARIDALLAAPALDMAWEGRLRVPYRELNALLPADDPTLADLRGRIASLYLERASVAREAGHFARARELASRGERFDPLGSGFAEARAAVDAAEEALALAEEAARRRARVASLERSVIEKADAGEPRAARADLGKLAGDVPPDDPFVTVTGPTAIATAYLRLATTAAARGDDDAALTIVGEALEVAPGMRQLEAARSAYEEALEARAVAALAPATVGADPVGATDPSMTSGSAPGPGAPPGWRAPLPATPPRGDPAHARAPVAPGAPVAPAAADLAPALGDGYASHAEDAIRALVDADPLDVAALGVPLATFAEIYPARRETLARAVAADLERRVEVHAGQVVLGDDALAAPIEAFAALFPERAAALLDRVAGIVGLRLDERAAAGPLDLPGLAGPLRQFATLFPAHAGAVHARLGETLAARVEAQAAADPLDLPSYATLLADYAALFPARADAPRAALADALAGRVADEARAAPTTFERLAERLAGFSAVFPERAPGLVEALAAIAGDGIVALADEGGTSPEALGPLLDAYAALFPDSAPAVGERAAGRIRPRIVRLAEATPLDLARLRGPVSAYRAVFPAEAVALEDALARRVAVRVGEFPVRTAADVGALGAQLAAVREMFPATHRRLAGDQARRVAGRIKALEARDKRAAVALRRAALEVFPGAEAIASIRIELPLAEIVDGERQVSAGNLTAASKLLAVAGEKDPRHSDLPAFRASVEERKARALAAYERYVTMTEERRPRPQRTAALAGARKLWADNDDFVARKEPRAGVCTGRLAALGKSSRNACHDRISSKRKGPELVVVPAGAGVERAYAIGRYEVSVGEFNLFCKVTRRCKARPGKEARLPVTGVNADLARGYTEWLSKLASKAEDRSIVYRLPSVAEWQHAAASDGQQPDAKELNCRVMSGANVLKGHGLLSVRSGGPNGWGLVNHIGNARELVTGGAGFQARGGSYEDPLARCDIALSVSIDGSGDPLTGLRLVREIGR